MLRIQSFISRAFALDQLLFLAKIHMEQDLNHICELLGQENSLNLNSEFQNIDGQRLTTDFRQHEMLISPANNQFRNRNFVFQTPSPYQHQLNYFQQQNSRQNQNSNFRQQSVNNKCISRVLDFGSSPKKTISPSLQLTVQKSPQVSEFAHYSSSKRDSKKNSKGLRNLSQSVYKIVLSHKLTTYKQVADQLVKMLNQGQFGEVEENQSKAKDQQNIKRRVYDALNVLISSDVLRKNGKFVSSDEGMLPDKMRFPQRINGKQKIGNLASEISKKRIILEQKKQALKNLIDKKQLLQSIIKRNRKKKFAINSQLSFPLIGIIYKQSKDNPLKIQNKNFNNIVKLKMQDPLRIIGDMDLISQVGIDILSQNIEEIIQQAHEQDYSQEQNFLGHQKEKNKQNGRTRQLRNNKKGKSKLLYCL